ncbi:hypothetical protein BGZ46_001899 [Entomortierella lignicola]|nr:hypothetical protein BGZ46_001899 [Entomortierella lignicola]
MALKQQISPFQIRNPYRLDRPHFDSIEVWQTAIAEEEESLRSQLSQRPLPSQPVSKTSPEANQSQQNHSYFGQYWFSQGFQQRTSVPQSVKQQHIQPVVPTITITHHIDTYSELTFERHVEWLTQTALWWDMPVVHLYPAPKSPAALEYVETAASRFSSWVNFVKIPADEELRLGPDTRSINSSQHSKIHESKGLKNTRKEADRDSRHEGGLVTGHSRVSGPRDLSTTNGTVQEVESIVGYVFVGSADEQSQYNQVFETMRKIYPTIEIRYINSFEPVHLQSRQQQELREEPCLHSLSWIHYWSAAKESQVLQSKIVNEVVRVRPMWTNGDDLHPNYTPALPQVSASSPTTTVRSTFNSATSLDSSPSVYIGGDDVENQNTVESLKGVPSTVSISSLMEMDMSIDESSQANHAAGFEGDQSVFTEGYEDFGRKKFDTQYSSKHISRTQSSTDIRQDTIQIYKPSSRSYKKWSFASLSGGNKKSGYRRSVSTPLLLLTKDGGGFAMNLSSKKNNKSMDTMDRCQDGDTNMSPPPLSPASLSSTSTSSSISSLSSMGSLSFSSRLTGLAQRLGVYKMKGSSLLVDV